jgi:RNA polymerase sigma factor (sigma-70 family)
LNEPEQRKLDPSVVAALFLEHGEELRRFLVGILRDHNSAADALQATFSKAIERGHMAREETQKGWLFRVAYNEAIVIKRKQAVQLRAVGSLGEERRDAGHAPLPDASLLLNEDAGRVRAALEALPPDQRETVRMRIYEDKKFAEIAAELGVPLGTVLTRMQAALKKLRKALES